MSGWRARCRRSSRRMAWRRRETFFFLLITPPDATPTHEPPYHGSYAGPVGRGVGLHRASLTRGAIQGRNLKTAKRRPAPPRPMAGVTLTLPRSLRDYWAG